MSPKNILVVEDDRFKSDSIIASLSQFANANIILAESVQAAVRTLNSGTYHLAVLDMALPSHDARKGGAAVTSLLTGGMEVIMELSYSGRRLPVVILTQYKEVEIEGRLVPLRGVRRSVEKAYGVNIEAALHFDPKDASWELALQNSVRRIL